MEFCIINRYGKLIIIFKGLDFGWDGTLNGKLLFADDYWFVVKRQDGKEFKGHFSLLR
ncbi:T9SS type B sorting domain-containing protein [Flavobacterium sp. UBA7682]|uniref:T9SS type B sorting domain-containing protein n=1 Tax=Flavobacterium sp. UBA7682 TaxID=1946560 RepID=UPI0025BE472D|nr:T9SS type B sorting domain-containing protein [Flavobacterium sp. UBA7682]